MGAMNEFWLVAPRTQKTTCFIIVTIVEIHRLIIDFCVLKKLYKKNF